MNESSLLEIVSVANYAETVSASIERIAASPEPARAQSNMVETIHALGAEVAFFVTFVRSSGDVSESCFMLSCDPTWLSRRLDPSRVRRDPWLAYAAHHAETALGDLPVDGLGDAESCLLEPEGRAGFASSLLVPSHSGLGRSRIGLLVLGSSKLGFFDGAGLTRLRPGARALSAELLDWWMSRFRRELLTSSGITPSDLDLLRHEWLGHGSKQIARSTHTSEHAVNSRFQRLNGKLGTRSRRAALRLVMDCGLLPFNVERLPS